jgi:hypothetical protein
MRSIIFAAIILASYCSSCVTSLMQAWPAFTQNGKEPELPPKLFFSNQAWSFTYSFPTPPDHVPPVKGNFRFVFSENQIDGYEDHLGSSRLVLRGTVKQDDPSNISWKINFGVVGSRNNPPAGQSIWDCAKHTRFGQWVPTSLSVSPDKQTISFQYPILEAGSNGDQPDHCREVPVLYRIIRAHELL